MDGQVSDRARRALDALDRIAGLRTAIQKAINEALRAAGDGDGANAGAWISMAEIRVEELRGEVTRALVEWPVCGEALGIYLVHEFYAVEKAKSDIAREGVTP